MKEFSKRVLAAILTMAVALTPAGVIHAAPAAEQETASGEMTYEEAKQASYDTLPETNSLEGWPAGPQVYGNAAIVMDINSGAVLYGKKVDEQHYPASITKLLTALVALENAELDDEVLFSQESIDILRSDYASIGMTPGEVISLRDAMYGMLLASGNEVAYAIAENVGEKMGGGCDTFIQEMNDRSAELGASDSHWVNANGLHDEQHYTTAYDMALIASELYKHEEFRTITQTLNYTIGTTNLVNETRTFQQNHKMLWPDNVNYYEYCTGGKTGYTDESRTTLVTMADNGELQLAAVVLQDDGDVYADTRAMFDYVYNNFSKVFIADQEKPQGVRSYEDHAAYVLLPEGIGFDELEYEIAVEDEKTAEGNVTYYYKGQNVGSADAVLTPEYVEDATGYTTRLAINEEGGQSDGGDETSEAPADEGVLPFLLRALAIAASVVICFLAIMFFAAVRYRRARMRKRRMMARRRRHQKSQRRRNYRY